MQKKKKKHGKIVLLARTKLNTIEILISRALADSYISHDEFILSHIVLKNMVMTKAIKKIKAHERF